MHVALYIYHLRLFEQKTRQTSEVGTTSLQGTNANNPRCPHLRGSTLCVVAYYRLVH